MIFSNVPKVSQNCGFGVPQIYQIIWYAGPFTFLAERGVPEESKISNLLLRLSLVSKRALGSRGINL
jgi:hypothetical protein